ncbi:hypothetical protein RJ639_037952 [Escallonia herrerae]|uniref:Flowering time control protein FCA n=1 Tax=Escallonia herrerae TaxID=1293975 RepID=A0AA88WQ73_9ASTE|nr:hypothetical protein RJ639_037952 [Escallonia herrerae]
MDRYSRGDRRGGSPDSQHDYRNSRAPSRNPDDGPPLDSYHQSHHRRSPTNYRGGFSGGGGRDHRPFDSPPRYPPGAGGGFRSMDGGGFRSMDGGASGRGGGDGFRQMDGGGGGRGLGDGGFSQMDGGGRGGGGGFRSMDGGGGGRGGRDGGFRPMGGSGGGRGGGDGGFRPMDGGGGGLGFISSHQVPLSGQKRGFPFAGRVGSPDHFDGASFAKLFVGSVPRTATEDDIRPLFEEHGRVLEVALIKDKRTGQQQGCCFIKYATSEEADGAIRALHNQHTLPEGVGPIQVRYADGERERSGIGGSEEYGIGETSKPIPTDCLKEPKARPVMLSAPICSRRQSCKLCNGDSLEWVGVGKETPGAGAGDDGEIGGDETERRVLGAEVEEVVGLGLALLDDATAGGALGYEATGGCGAVEYKLFVGSLNKQATEKEVEEGCDQPLTVRFADPKRPRPGESRGGPAFGGPGFGPRFQPPGIRPTPNLGEPMPNGIPSNAWRPMSPQNMAPSSNAGMHSFGSQLLPGCGDMTASSVQGGPFGGHSLSSDGPVPALAVSVASTSQLSYNQSLTHLPSSGQLVSPSQKAHESPQQFPSSLQLQPQTPASYSQTQTSSESLLHLQNPKSASQTPFGQEVSQHYLGQSPVSKLQILHNAPSAAAQGPWNNNLPGPLNNNLPPHVISSVANQHQLPAQQKQLPLLNQPPSQLAQMLSQQTQTLQASFQSSQQAFSQLQQQLQLMQPSNQGLPAQQNSQPSKQQSPWAGVVSKSAVSTPANQPVADVPPATSSSPAVPVASRLVAPTKCNWTEHTAPDGYKYYHNSITQESKWEKPEELTLYEQEQQPHQKPLVQQPQSQPHPQGPFMQHVSQTPHLQLHNQSQIQLQSQLRHPQQVQQSFQSSSYQAPGLTGHRNIQVGISDF